MIDLYKCYLLKFKLTDKYDLPYIYYKFDFIEESM